jgi:hypothetical protein
MVTILDFIGDFLDEAFALILQMYPEVMMLGQGTSS